MIIKKRKKVYFFRLLCFFCAFFCFNSVSEVSLSKGKITADFQGMSLKEALTEMSKKTKVTIETTSPLANDVDFSCKNMPIEKVFNYLLAKKNAIYLRDSKGELERIRIFSKNTPKVKEKEASSKSNISNLENGLHKIVVTINGKDVELLIDTGANRMTLSGALARRLSLPFGQSVTIKTAGGIVSGNKTVIDELVLADKTHKNVPAIILDTLDGNGLIGTDILKKYTLIKEGNRISLSTKEKIPDKIKDKKNTNNNEIKVKKGTEDNTKK